MPQDRKPTPAERAKWREMDKQLDALQAESYRITCIHATEDKPPLNIGKGKDPGGKEKLYTAEEVKEKVGLLSAKNANGYNIYITPIDGKRYFMVIDDLDIDRARDFWGWGYRPALVQKSSQDSIQAVSILRKEDVSHRAGNALFKRLNRRIGDPRISGFIHPFRLAGFSNQKPSRRLANGLFAFVEVLRHGHRVDEKATCEAQVIDEEMARDTKAAKAPLASNIPVTRAEAGDLDVSAARCWYQRKLDYWGDQADRSKIDRELDGVTGRSPARASGR